MGSFLLQSFWDKKLEINFLHFYIGSLNISNKPFPSCPKPLFQSEAKCETIDTKFFLILMQTKLNFTNKGFARSCVLNGGVFGTRKWVIEFVHCTWIIHDSLAASEMGHFRFASSLCFKARLSAKPLIWKWFLLSLKLIFTWERF